MAAMQTQTRPVPVTGLPTAAGDGIGETKKIPLVGHIITDDDLGILQVRNILTRKHLKRRPNAC